MDAPAKLGPGTVIGNEYKIIRPLAKGAMGAVFVAEQMSTGVERAVKLMHLQLTSNPKALERFTQEARISAALESDHVVKVLGAGLDEAARTPWIAMELLKGQDLGAVAKERGRLPPAEVLEIFRQLCDGLTVAHASNIVHRDLKPENIFIANAQRNDVPYTVKILDFGISKVMQEFDSNMTAAVGSPMWMAPEQSRRGKVSSATDVWPLGLIAFRLLTGRNYWKAAQKEKPPVQDVLIEVMASQLEPPSVRAAAIGVTDPLPAGFDAWFAKCVAREPADRFPSVTEAMNGFRDVMSGAAPATGPAPTVTDNSPPAIIAPSASANARASVKPAAAAATKPREPAIAKATDLAKAAASKPVIEPTNLVSLAPVAAILGLVMMAAAYLMYRF